MLTHTTIGSVALLALAVTPVEVVPAPGPGQVNQLLGFYAVMSSVGTAYTVAGGVDLAIAGTELNTGNTLSTLLRATGDANAQNTRADSDLGLLPGGDMTNQPITIAAFGGAVTTGDGTLDLWVTSQVVTL